MTRKPSDDVFVAAMDAGCEPAWCDGIVGLAWHCTCEGNRHAADQQCSVITLESARRGALAYFIDGCRAVASETPEGGAPDLDQVRALIKAYYAMDGNATGGSLHVVLDDSNWTNAHIERCIERARDEFHYGDCHMPADPAGVALGELLRLLTLDQRVELACSCCKDSVREEGL